MIRKSLFYPLNYGNSDNSDFRFSAADCKQPTTVVCAEIASTGYDSVLNGTGNYTMVQRLVSRQDAICRELFERAIATAFAHFENSWGSVGTAEPVSAACSA